jgi:ribosome-associated heat shock protein Hsp15
MAAPESARVDRWLWAVRLFKTRSAAAEACRAGHVRVRGARAKASTPVRVGDSVQVRAGGRLRVVEVARVLDARVGAAEAAACLVDRSPAPPPRPAPEPRRERGAGRPSKRERRQLDRSRGRRGR